MKLSKFDLNKKNVLITGAAGLLGYEHAFALCETNANIILTDINVKKLKLNQKKLENIFKKKILVFYLDVSKKPSIAKVLKILRENKIRVDILINNAAIDPKSGTKLLSRFEDFKIENWNRELSVGLTGAFLCSQLFGTLMSRDNKGGVILNIASDLSIIAPDQRIYKKSGVNNKDQNVKPVTYSVIKHGLIGLTKYTATYWANNGIRCNAISPGGIIDQEDKVFYNKVRKLVPLNRMADKNEYHAAIQFLCSDASSYMTGHNLVIDGGRSIW